MCTCVAVAVITVVVRCSQVEAPLQAAPAQTEAAASEDDPFASFVEEDSKDKVQASAEGAAMDIFGAPTAGGGFGTDQVRSGVGVS